MCKGMFFLAHQLHYFMYLRKERFLATYFSADTYLTVHVSRIRFPKDDICVT